MMKGRKVKLPDGRKGTVIYVHPLRRFALVELEGLYGNRIRQCVPLGKRRGTGKYRTC